MLRAAAAREDAATVLAAASHPDSNPVKLVQSAEALLAGWPSVAAWQKDQDRRASGEWTAAVGVDPDSPEGQERIRRYLEAKQKRGR